MTPTPSSSKSKVPLFIGLGLALAIATVGAAFLAGRYLNQPAASTGPQGLGAPGGAVGSLVGGGPGGDVNSVQLQVNPAPELPKLPPEVAGMYVSREDNRLFIATCNMGIAISESGDSSQSSGDGPQVLSQGCGDSAQVEVVVTQDTKVYHDTTQLDPSQPPTGAIQQTVAPGSVDDLSANTSVIVWGRRTGDRVIADVLMYSQPMIIERPGP